MCFSYQTLFIKLALCSRVHIALKQNWFVERRFFVCSELENLT